MTDRHVILAAVEHEIGLTRREIAKFLGPDRGRGSPRHCRSPDRPGAGTDL